MRDFDHSDLDGRLLQLLLAVVEEGSVTHAAQRLGVTQSAVSHLLDKLRAIVDDPLFVKSGRGIVATARAQALAVQARLLLDSMRRFVTVEQFDPARLDTTLCIAANDLQRDLLLPALFSRLRAQAPRLQLHVLPSDVPEARLLRDLQSCEAPLPCPAMPMYMVWHLRHQHDPVHRWLRRELEAVAAAVLQNT